MKRLCVRLGFGLFLGGLLVVLPLSGVPALGQPPGVNKDQEKSEKGRFGPKGPFANKAKGIPADPIIVFAAGDTSGDGKLDKGEFAALIARSPRGPLNPEERDELYRKLDANGDGFLSREEFREIRTLRGPAGLAKGPDLDKKGTRTSEPSKNKPPKDTNPETVASATPEQLAFFEKKIRPVLIDQCYACHSTEGKGIKGGLALDTREGIRKGGDTGPGVVPGDLGRSLVIKAIRYHDDDLKMPPKAKLADPVVKDFETWVKSGAADPRSGTAKTVKNEVDQERIEKGRSFWAFQKPKKSPAAPVSDPAWPRTEIDRYLLAAQESKGIHPVADADPMTLLRRVHLDLTGLPPTPEEVERFVADPSLKALESVVDKLLASKAYAERWGRHWLDVARYAQSSGKQINFSYPHAWRYRDYVIQSFHEDKPYDQFVREQIAGDLLNAPNMAEKSEALVATGFLAIGPKAHNERIPQQFVMDLVDEQIDATFTAFQGLTVACARCHDHKFDPIPTRDYYALAGIFRSTETLYGTVRTIQSNHPSSLINLPTQAEHRHMAAPLSSERREGIAKQVRDLKDQEKKLSLGDRFGSFNGIRLRIQITNLESVLALYDDEGKPRALAMGVRDKTFPSDTQILARGELDHPGERAKRGFPQVMTEKQPSIRKGSGRLELANWIATADNPLTARVMVNRIWTHLFGNGIVGTPDNFGEAGDRPTHPELLDHLAIRFVEKGWSIKALIRELVLTRAYGLAADFDARAHEIDPDNSLVWRMPKRRLEAEALRDSMLAAAGTLDPHPPATDPIAMGGEGNVNVALRLRPIDSFATEPYRSVYIPVLRDQLPEALNLFDFPDPTLIAGERAVTTVPAQSLYMMNNPFVIKQAEILASKLLASSGSDEEKLRLAWLTAFSRPPSQVEISLAKDFLNSFQAKLRLQRPAETRRQSWAALVQALFASAEFAHR